MSNSKKNLIKFVTALAACVGVCYLAGVGEKDWTIWHTGLGTVCVSVIGWCMYTLLGGK